MQLQQISTDHRLDDRVPDEMGPTVEIFQEPNSSWIAAVIDVLFDREIEYPPGLCKIPVLSPDEFIASRQAFLQAFLHDETG